MNILVFSWRDPKHPLAGGAEQVMHEHMKGWIKAGHSVTLFSSKSPKLEKEEIIDGVKIVRKGNQYLGVQVHGFLHYLSNSKNYDLVVDQFHGLPFFTPLYCHKPTLAVIQETAQKVWFLNPFPFPLNYIVGAIGFLLEPLIFLLYKKTQFMTGSESAKSDLKHFGIKQDKITIVPHGVITHQPTSSKKQKTPTIVFLGILSKDKGIEDAIYCFSQMQEAGNFRFWVIGRPEAKSYFNQVKLLAKKLDVQVKFWGFVSQQEKFNLLARSHLLINPSHHEGWGLVNIEANSVGTPVIAYNSQGLVDSVQNGRSGIIVKNNTPEELSSAAINLLADKKLFEKLQTGAKSWAKNFSWATSQKQSLSLIQKSLS